MYPAPLDLKLGNGVVIAFSFAVYCDQFRGRAHAQLAGKETRADGPGVWHGDAKPRRQKEAESERYQTSYWPMTEKYGGLPSCDWFIDRVFSPNVISSCFRLTLFPWFANILLDKDC